MTAELFLRHQTWAACPAFLAALFEGEAVQKCVGIINMRPMVLKTVAITEIVEKLDLVEQETKVE